MIHYDPAHHSFVGFALDSGAINENTAPASIPDAPTNFSLCGYTNHPEGKRGLNNSYGFSIGQRGGAYRKRGAQAPSLSMTLRGGGAIELLNLTSRIGDELPWICFYVGVPRTTSNPGWIDVYRKAKINSLSFALKETQGEAAEVEVNLQAEALCRYNTESTLSITSVDITNKLGALREPLFWHDVRTFNINGVDFRQALTGLNVKIEHGIERKGERPNWGDHERLSRTSYHLLEHTVTVSGDLSLHSRLGASYFTGAAQAQNWGDIALSITNESVLGDNSTKIGLTLKNCIPTDETTGGVEPKAQIGHAVPFVASDYVLTATIAQKTEKE